jgi:hypothetical protein
MAEDSDLEPEPAGMIIFINKFTISRLEQLLSKHIYRNLMGMANFWSDLGWSRNRICFYFTKY